MAVKDRHRFFLNCRAENFIWNLRYEGRKYVIINERKVLRKRFLIVCQPSNPHYMFQAFINQPLSLFSTFVKGRCLTFSGATERTIVGRDPAADTFSLSQNVGIDQRQRQTQRERRRRRRWRGGRAPNANKGPSESIRDDQNERSTIISFLTGPRWIPPVHY